MMRISMIVLLALLLSWPAAAQEEETLIGGDIDSGWYAGILTQFGQIVGETGVFVGLQGGWIINHRFVLGAKGYGLANSIDVEGLENIKHMFGCGGVLLEYIFASNKVLHFSVNTMIGAGGVNYDVKDYRYDHDDIDYYSDEFFVLEPGANLVMNVHKRFRIGAGATYRYVTGVNYDTLSDSDLSGVSGQIVLMFGAF